MKEEIDCMKCEKLHECIEKIEVPPLAAIYAKIPPYLQGEKCQKKPYAVVLC